MSTILPIKDSSAAVGDCWAIVIKTSEDRLPVSLLSRCSQKPILTFIYFKRRCYMFHNEGLKLYGILICLINFCYDILIVKVCRGLSFISNTERKYRLSNLWYKPHLIRQYTCWSFRYRWSIACRHCNNYIFIPDLSCGLSGLGKDNCKTRREAFKFWILPLILEVWRYTHKPIRLGKVEVLLEQDILQIFDKRCLMNLL